MLLYNTEICTAAISCYISEGKHHALADAILDLFSANRVEQKLIVHCLQCELDSNRTYSTNGLAIAWCDLTAQNNGQTSNPLCSAITRLGRLS